MKISNVKEIIVDRVPALQMDLDGKTARLFINQKRTWLEKFGAVFLGSAFEADTKVEIPADPTDHREAMTLEGFTQDTEVVKLYREFLQKHGG